MKAIVLAPFLFALACQPKERDKTEPATKQQATEETGRIPESKAREENPAQPKTALALDLDRLCNAEELSGALDLPTGDRALHTGIWLAKNIETQEVRDFVAELTKLGPDERIARLTTKLAEHEISSCEIVHAWSGAG